MRPSPAATSTRGDIPNQSGDLSFVINQLTGRRDRGPLAGKIDARIGAVGHSDGADTVLDLGYHPRSRSTRGSGPSRRCHRTR